MSVPAVYYDGRSSRRHEVTVDVTDGALYVRGTDFERREPLSALRIGERFGNGPRLLHLPDGAILEIRDHAGLSLIMTGTGLKPDAVEFWQESWRIAVAAMAVVVLSAVLGYLYGLPIVADVMATRTPDAVTRQLSESTLEALDGRWLEPSSLDPARQAALQSRFEALDFGNGEPLPALEFRHGGSLGANAFALPDGTIVVLDELVALVEDDDDLNAVLAHELGHVQHRHGLKMLLQGSVVALTMTAWLGDVSTLLALLPTAVLQSRYSRAFETEADDYAMQLLKARHIDPARLATMLERLVQHQKEQHGNTHESGWLSSHPAPDARIRRLRGENPAPDP